MDPEHGTFIGGLAIAGATLNGPWVCPEPDGAEIVDLAIFPDEKQPNAFSAYYSDGPFGFFDELNNAIEDARARHGVRVFNMSLNIGIPASPKLYSQYAARLDQIAEDNNVLIFVSAGNTEPQDGHPEWPADASVALSDLAIAQNDRLLVPAESVRNVSVAALNPPGQDGCLPFAPACFSRRGPGLRSLQQFIPVYVIPLAYMAGHAGRSPPFRFGHARLARRGAPLRRASRHSLSRGLCERTDWHDASGRPRLSAAARALPVLAGRLGLDLPAARGGPDPTAGPAVPDADVPDTVVARPLGDPGPVSLDPVGDAADRRLWEAMMERRHPRGRSRPPGGQVRYRIRPERHGVPGGIGFGSAAWRPGARDAWIGWGADALAASIGRVVRDHRFLPRGGVRVYGLASEVPPMAAARVADDREARYPVRPVASRTHVGPETGGYRHHRAGWTVAGRGSGRRAAAGTVRVLALEEGWRGTLHGTRRRPVGAPGGAYDGADGMDRAERGYGRSGHDLRADPPADR